MTIDRYVLVDLADREQDTEYDSYDSAVEAAAELGYAVVERTYTFHDSNLVWTPDGSYVWPPELDEDEEEEEED